MANPGEGALVETRGHLFVIDGDLTKIACDAWLLPTDSHFDITNSWAHIFPGDRLVRERVGDKRYQYLNGCTWPVDKLGCVIKYGTIDGSDVYLANIGHVAADPKVYSGAVLEFIRLATEGFAGKGRRPRLAINQIGSGHGGGKQVRGGILDHLILTLETELNAGRITADVVLASWGEKAEAAAQYLRLDGQQDSYVTSAQWHFDNSNLDLHARARDLALHFKARNACIFMGAGVSGGAGLPMWSELLRGLATGTLLAANTEFAAADVLSKASMLKNELGAAGFAARIDEALASPKYSLLHGLLSSLPCNEFITTNVEQLFEKAASSKERGITILPSTEEQHLIDRWLLKIHGCVSEPSSMVLTRKDYDSSISSRRALFGVLQAMLLTRHIVFVGYSLSDPDFLEIVQEVNDALPQSGADEAGGRKLGTVLTLFTDSSPDPLVNRLFDIVPISSGTKEDATTVQFETAVRDLERFIDLIGMLSSDRAAFLLDSRYSALLSPDEQYLARSLASVVENAEQFASSSGWDQVWDLLRSLGAHPDLIGADRPHVLADVPHRSSM